MSAPRKLEPGTPGIFRGRGVKASDARKAAVVAALKAASNCRKVTLVTEASPNTYRGNCMNPNAGGVPGFWEVEVRS